MQREYTRPCLQHPLLVAQRRSVISSINISRMLRKTPYKKKAQDWHFYSSFRHLATTSTLFGWYSYQSACMLDKRA